MGIGLGLTCVAVWLLLSGYFDNPLLLGLGALSCVLVLWLARRMGLHDADDPSAGLLARFLLYLPWLCKEIVLANIDVTRRVLSRDIERAIDPRLFRVRASQRGDLAKTIYANSITLTPGTITTVIDGDWFEVHALSREGAEGIQQGGMNRRVARIEDPDSATGGAR